jgi:hypothetical protein
MPLENLQHLFLVAKHDKPSPEATQYARENAISAIGKICRFLGPFEQFDLQSVLSEWVQLLPILKDSEEAAPTYSYLMELIEARHPCVFPPNVDPVQSQVRVSGILVQALASPDFLEQSSDKELAGKMAHQVKGLLGGLDENSRNSLWTSLTPDQKSHLHTKGYF